MSGPPERETLEGLRQKVDDLSREVARLTGRAEKLSERLTVARREAKAAEARLAGAPVDREGFFSQVFDNAGTVLAWLPFLPALILPVAIIIGVLEVCEDLPYEYRASGSCVSSEANYAPAASRCDLTVRAGKEGLCRATVSCGAEAAAFDGEVSCRMDGREGTDSDGDPTTYYVLVAWDLEHDPPWLELDEDVGIASVRDEHGGALIVIHEDEEQGNLEESWSP